MPLPPGDYQYFTLVFKGDIGKFEKNVMTTDSPFGRPIAAGRGDAFEEIDLLLEKVEALSNGQRE